MEEKNNKNRKSINKRGFSFVEVLVSVFLISIGLVAAVSLISSDLARVIGNRDQAIAGLLAQEGTELVTNIRDSAVRNGELSFFNSLFPESSSDNCIIDPLFVSAGVNLYCVGGDVESFYYSSDQGYYHDLTPLDDAKKTKFKRKISVDYSPLGDALTATSMKVTSMVIWGNSSFPSTTGECNTSTKCTYVETILTGWKD